MNTIYGIHLKLNGEESRTSLVFIWKGEYEIWVNVNYGIHHERDGEEERRAGQARLLLDTS